MKILLFALVVTCFLKLEPAQAAEGEEVKAYLVSTLEKVKAAADDFVHNTQAYAALATQEGGVVAAFAKQPSEVRRLVTAMQENYKAMDSFGYETVEGIVAGVERFTPYDVYLDAGVPTGEGQPEEIAPVKLQLSNGEKVEGEGSSFTYLMEPTLWGGSKKWCVPVDLDGDGKVAPRESLPNAGFLSAVAEDTQAKLAALLADAKAWQPTLVDLFQAMVAMTPTLSDYFEDWKESRYSEAQSGRFFAVSRLSDMQGIMQSCAVMYQAVQNQVSPKDQALARTIDAGFKDIFAFLGNLQRREEQSAKGLPVAVIDEMASQAKARTDKLVPQIKQAAALVGVQIAA